MGQERYEQEQEKLKREWERAQREVQEEERRHHEEVSGCLTVSQHLVFILQQRSVIMVLLFLWKQNAKQMT